MDSIIIIVTITRLLQYLQVLHSILACILEPLLLLIDSDFLLLVHICLVCLRSIESLIYDTVLNQTIELLWLLELVLEVVLLC